uniref:YceD family protein n=1 Tax=Acetatifactor sp. TaxID=1872090 RepID=UPI004056ED3E
MLVNLSDVLTSAGKVENTTVALELNEFTSKLGTFSIKEKSDVEFTFTNIGVNKAKVEGTLKLFFETECDRCLTEVSTVLNLKFERVVTAPDVMADDDEDEDPDYMEGYQLNVETFVYNEILINWPAKILCKEDCKGVCLKCGQNLNERECGCDTFVPDPRMAVLKDIFNANKEV